MRRNLKEGMARQKGRVLQAAPPPPKAVTCSNCGFENPGTSRTCSQCGAPLPGQEALKARAGAGIRAKARAKEAPHWLIFGGIAAFLLCCVAIAPCCS
jgi:uncharacterized membrane protein YvbJ